MTSHAQRLVNGLFEAVVRLLYIPIFMGYPGIVPRWLHPVMSHKRLVALRPVLHAALALLLDCRAQMISAVVLWNASDLPQAVFNPLSQSLKAFAEADPRRLHIGVGQHQVEHHMGKRFASNADTEVLHVREIRLRSLTGGVPLGKNDFLVWSLHGSPFGNVPLQGAYLGGSVAAWMPLAQQSKQRGPLQCRITCELFYDPLPIVLERILPGRPGMRTLELRWQLTSLFVLASRSLTHPSSCCSNPLCRTFPSFLHVQLNLCILFHRDSPLCVE